jgi:hypothetical protein
MVQFDSAELLIEFLRLRDYKLVAIDGFPAAGKSTLAKYIGTKTAMRVISIDMYLSKNKGSYFPHLDLTKIGTDIDMSEKCIVEGLCCLKVLNEICRPPTAIIYVKRTGRCGWLDEDDLTDKVDQELAAACGELDAAENSYIALMAEVRAYHASYRPHETSDIEYLRAEA